MAERVNEPSGWGRGENVCVWVWSGGCEGDGDMSVFRKERRYFSYE